jgi:parvulin-like peptidyl-prolyl isomerase
MKKILTALFLLTFITGCSDFNKLFGEKKKTADSKVNSVVLAKVGDEKITKEDLMKSLEGLPPNQRILYASTPEKLKKYLDSYITQVVMFKEAEKRGIDKREDIKENLENYKRRLLIRALNQEIMSEKISEEDIKKYYNENPKDFEQIRISQIFIKADPAKGITNDHVRAKGELVMKRLGTGEKFEKLVEEFSEDLVSKKQGGDLGYISKGTLLPDVESKIFSLKEGEIGTIEDESGFHIVKVTEGAKVLPFDQAKDTIQLELRRKALSDYTKGLRDKAVVEIFEDKLKETKPK